MSSDENVCFSRIFSQVFKHIKIYSEDLMMNFNDSFLLFELMQFAIKFMKIFLYFSLKASKFYFKDEMTKLFLRKRALGFVGVCVPLKLEKEL